MPANILNLPSYAVTALQENDHDYHVDAEVRQAVTQCIHCKASNPQGFGRRDLAGFNHGNRIPQKT